MKTIGRFKHDHRRGRILFAGHEATRDDLSRATADEERKLCIHFKKMFISEVGDLFDMPGVKVTWTIAGPDDPMYKEGYQSYSPHWAREWPLSRTKREDNEIR
jgi:hypothetical protein